MRLRKRVFSLSALTAAVMAIIVLSFAVGAMANDPHSFSEGECALCHQQEGDGRAWVMTFPKADISAECVQCHNSCDNWQTHGEQQKDIMEMAEALPLLADEKISCVTCHSTHGGAGSEGTKPDPGMLRISNLKRGLCLNCHRENRGGSVRVEITVPPESAVVYDTRVPLIGRIDNLAESHVTLRVNQAVFPLRITGGLFHTRLRVEEGANHVELSLNGEILWSGNIFRARGDEQASYYGKMYSGHQTDSLDECLGCHEQEDGLLRAGTASLPDLCYGCHEPFDEKRYLHGPLAVGECTSCHDPHGGTGPYHLRGREVSLCLSCHEDDEVLGHEGGRIAVADGSCSACHDPHQSDTRFLVKEAALSGTAD